MKSSRVPHSELSVSSRSYMSNRTRHRSCSSRHSSDSTKKPSRKMKFIIAMGIALPIVAAIIGVVAWAVSADTAFEGSVVNNLRRSDMLMQHHDEDIFQALEDRQDVEFSHQYSPPNQDLEKHDFSRLDNVENHNQFDDTINKDPLYVVHFVPSPKPKVESSSSDSLPASTVSNDVLQKILSASKGTKPGTPQFVVFAPVPEEGGTKPEAGSLEIGSQGLNLFQKPQGTHKEIDYDYEEELRRYQELLDTNDQPPQKETSRVGQEKNKVRTHADIHKETLKLLVQNLTSGSLHQSHHHQSNTPSSNIIPAALFNQQTNQLNQQLNQQQSLAPQHSYQQNTQSYPHSISQAIQQGYSQQPVQQPQTYDQQQYYPQESNYAANAQVYPQQAQPQATDRSGQYEPVGIRLNFGGGRGLLGGNYSPLGIIGSILRPLLPRAQANLNGKMMFGIMLENGVKLGNRGGHQAAYG